MNYYLALDTETGGLNPESVDVLTCYMAVVNEDFKIVEDLDLKLKPDDRLPRVEEQALAINKIDIKKHLEDPSTITYSEAKRQIVIMLKKYLKKTGRHSNIRGMGFNYDFDEKFINKHLIPTDEWNGLINYNTVDPKVITNFMKDAGWVSSELGTLVSVVKYFQIPMGAAHNAKNDTLATIEVYKKYLELMTSKKDGGGQNVDLISLLESE